MAGVFVGIGTSLLYTATNSLPLQWFNSKLGTANGIVKAGGGVGATVLPLAAQALIDKYGLNWTFRIFGILIMVTGVPCARVLRERPRTDNISKFDWSLLKNTHFLLLAAAGAIGVFALFVPPFFLPLFASSFGLSPAIGAGLVAGFGASTAIGRLLGGCFSDLIGPLNATLITTIVNSLSMLVIWPVSASLPPLFIFAIINGIANGSFFVAFPTAVAAIAPPSASASISLTISFWTPGYLLGTPIAGILMQATEAADSHSIKSFRAAIFYAAGVGVVATVLIFLLRRRMDAKMIKRL
ncbi:hypothetical protein ANO11243_034710 [Dothideomycetidae sp. 11243]|nr:hypothetical protein ANO11243_034710 [fungal sp. No.11243]